MGKAGIERVLQKYLTKRFKCEDSMVKWDVTLKPEIKQWDGILTSFAHITI